LLGDDILPPWLMPLQRSSSPEDFPAGQDVAAIVSDEGKQMNDTRIVTPTPLLRVSIVVTTYNGERFILEQLRSLANQSLKPFEIIVSDDASTDGTEAIVSEFARSTDIPVRFYKNETPLGFADNFMAGTRYACGELIAFCDQDDLWHPDKVSTCTDAFWNEKVVLAVHAARLIDRDNSVIGYFNQNIDQDCIRTALSFDPWELFFGFSMVFRRTLLEVIPDDRRGIDFITGNGRLSHDRWILYLANMLGCTQQIAATLVDYRQHDSNLFGAPKGKWRKSLASMRRERDLRVRAALELRSLIDSIKDCARHSFPMFDRALCEEFWDKVISQQTARRDVYFSPSKLAAWRGLLQNVRHGVYLNANDGRFHWGAVAKDFYSSLARDRG
jgi:glycosyltransferase involved in cell wall biosynthesis